MKAFKIFIISFMLLGFSVNSFAGGFIIVFPQGSPAFANNSFNPYSLEVKYIKVDVKINGLIAVTTVEEVFYNPTNINLEGWFMFPVPKYSAMKNFSMEINGKQTPAELLDSEKARQVYEDIVRKMKDPALLEYSDQGMYKVRIFPIESKKEKKIIFTYTEVLSFENELTEYFFPLNTEKFSAKPLKNVSFKVDISSEQSITTIYSPTHKTDVNRISQNKAVVGFEQEEVKPDIDFKLFIGNSNSPTGISLMSYMKNTNTEGFFLMNISPGYIDKQDKIIPKDIVFVIDVSGSMEGEKLTKAKAALTYCITNLNKNDKFNIVRFSTTASTAFESKVLADEKNKTIALAYIIELKAIGGTNMQEAFQLAFNDSENSNSAKTVIFITDGKPTIGETDNDKLLSQIGVSNKNKSRIFTFGIGNDLNTILLDKITENTNAFRTYISESEEIDSKISTFFDKVGNPVLTDISVEVKGSISADEIFPRKLPDLYKGSSITVLGKMKSDGNADIILTGKVNGETKTFKYTINAKSKPENDFIPVLWATRKVGFLLDQIRLNGENKEIVEEIKSLAKEYGIVTPYTSYLIIEDEKVITLNNNIGSENSILSSDIIDDEDGFQDKTKKEYAEIYSKSGAGSVRASQELQNLNSAEQVFDSRQGTERMVYNNESGESENFGNQIRNVGGRAFYQNSIKWIDVYSVKNTTKRSEIVFNSNEYYDLLKKEPSISQFYALGRNVEFEFKGKVYNIHE
jgi:Ca-activated chloride channel family protein